jgi:hypothetical protein
MVEFFLLEPCVSNRPTVPEPPLFIEVDSEKEFKLKEIIQSKYMFNVLCYYMQYKVYSAGQCEWLPAENLAHVQDMVHEFHTHKLA